MSREQRAKDLDNNGVVDLIREMFQLLRDDYLSAVIYIRDHPDDYDSPAYVQAMKTKTDCETFTETQLYHSITDYAGDNLLRDFQNSM